VKTGFDFKVRDEGHQLDAFLLGVGSVATVKKNIPWIGEVCIGHYEEIQDGGL
jgi:hypothetical protein